MNVNNVLDGVRVLEVAAWTFVPAAGAVLAEWGAEVIKVEPRAVTRSAVWSPWDWCPKRRAASTT
jgi:crotonobetainyl-CoA:carnitine CoA-transferase CaiB-like acyl-CoA transferase